MHEASIPIQEPTMTPAGFNAKKICLRPNWLKSEAVEDIWSVSNCMSEDFCDYIQHWKHNGYWLFNSLEDIRAVAAVEGVDLVGHEIFYYEVHEQQFDDENKVWESFDPDEAFTTDVAIPEDKQLEGFDVVSFCAHTDPECSPLSCNGMASSIAVNKHCLLANFEEAKFLMERGAFKNCEPGPYRIFAVYSCAPE